MTGKLCALAILIFVAATSARGEPAPQRPQLFPTATHVTAYLYKQGQGRGVLSSDFRAKNPSAVPVAGVTLSTEQVARLRTAMLQGLPPEESDTLCAFDPHHGFVFTDDKGVVVGTLDVCFECDLVEYNAPGYHPGGVADGNARRAAGIPPRYEVIDWTSLERLVNELKLPAHPIASDYEGLGGKAAH